MVELAVKVSPFVQKNLRWNFSVNLIDITFITLAFSLISRETIMPLLISNLTDSKIAIGLVPAIFSIAFYLPQLFAANHAERLKRKLPFVMFIGGLLERVPYFFAGFAVLYFAESAPTVALLAVYLVIGLGALGAGVATPAWFTMIGKVLPVNRRGIFFGVSDGLGTLMAFVGAFFVGIILDDFGYPQNFATLFIAAACFMGISWIGLALNREPESPIVKEHISLRRYFKRLPAILRGNHNFRRFLLSYSISRLSLMGTSFFIVFGNENFNLTGADVGALDCGFAGQPGGNATGTGLAGGQARAQIQFDALRFRHGAGGLHGIIRNKYGQPDTGVCAVGDGAGSRPHLTSEYRAGIRLARRPADIHRADEYAFGAGGISGADHRRLGGRHRLSDSV